MSNEDLSRREALGGGAAAVLAGVGAALAVSAVGRDAAAQGAGDVGVLNTLLRAEYDAIRTYEAASGSLGMPDMMDPDRALGPAAALVAGHYVAQHRDHATRLRNMIMSMQGTPVDQSTILFMPPAGFRLTVRNILRLACNKEKGAAIAYTNALKTLSSAASAELVAAIGAVETQHFIVLYLLLKGAAGPGMMAATMISEICPRSVVAIEGETSDLSGVPDFAFMPL
jgi:bacterioferritin (cytochrome b1)